MLESRALVPRHTRDWEPTTIALQALSLVEKVELVQVHFTLRLRDQWSKCMQDGWYSLHRFLHGIGWIILYGCLDYFHQPNFGGRPNKKQGDHGTPNAHNCWFILDYHVWGPASIEIHWNSIWLRDLSHMTSHFTCVRIHDHTTWCWRCVGTAFGHFLLGSHNFTVAALGSCAKWHTRDWEPVTSMLQALSWVEKAEPVQVRFTLRLRDQRSMWMQDGCKVYMDSYMASNGSCFMVTWTIFKDQLLEVGLTQNWETMAPRTFTTAGLFYFIMWEGPHE